MEEREYQGAEAEQAEQSGQVAVAATETGKVPFYKKLNLAAAGELSVAIFGIALQLYLLAIFLGGTVSVFGRSITVVSAMDFILQIFNVTRATAYRRIAELLIGVGYIVLAVFMAKQTWETAKAFLGYLRSRKPEGDAELKRFCFSRVTRGGIASFEYICLLIVGVHLFASASIEQQTVAAMVLVGIAVSLRRFVPCFEKRESFDWLAACTNAAIEGLILICVCLLLGLFREAAAEKLVAGCKMLFNGNIISGNGTARTVLYAIYAYLLFPVLSGALAVTFMRLLHGYFHPSVRGKKLASAITKFIVFAAVCTLIHFIFHSFINSNVSTFNLQMVWDWIGSVKDSYLPMLILLCVWRVLESRTE